MAEGVKEVTEDFAQMLADHESRNSNVEMGQKIKGKIIEINGDDVFLDIGLKQDGIMDHKDILNVKGEEFVGSGDEIEGYVTRISPQGIRISRSISGAGMAALEEALESGAPVDGKIISPCKGGYHVEILGKTAFCPGSQMEYLAEGEDPTGRHLPFLVTRIENRGRNIVVSHRSLKERERKENLDKLLSSINIGDIVEGTISRLAPFGAFIELEPGVEGMAHISELSWSHPANPQEVISVGDKVKAKILEIGEDAKKRLRISLSIKQALEDPWLEAEKKYIPGDVVVGTVRRLAPFGAFIELVPGIEGLVHLSEMSWEKRINKADELLSPGDKVQVKIKDVDSGQRRISLSLKEVQGDPWQEVEEKLVNGSVVEAKVESRSIHGIFVNLMPGITGLLPSSSLKNSPEARELAKLEPGDSIKVVIQKIDPVAKRISLSAYDESHQEVESPKNWREHAKGSESGSQNLGIMAQALNRAFQKKGVSK